VWGDAALGSRVGSRVSQDLTVAVSRALPAVFAILADPTRLSAWVSDVTDVSRDRPADRPALLEESFALRLGDRAAVGEIISHEPPWSVAYRLTTANSSHVLRISCTASEDGATQVHIQQANAAALAIDLSALNRTLLDLDLTRRRLPDGG
jgi:Polyketide cyclase / dehydrase and lipid transport